MLRSFARWFASGLGVWITFGLCTLIAVLEQIFPQWDEHGFWLLYWLTFYSAITQPVLAFANREDTSTEDAVLREIKDVEQRILDTLQKGTGDSEP